MKRWLSLHQVAVRNREIDRKREVNAGAALNVALEIVVSHLHVLVKIEYRFNFLFSLFLKQLFIQFLVWLAVGLFKRLIQFNSNSFREDLLVFPFDEESHFQFGHCLGVLVFYLQMIFICLLFVLMHGHQKLVPHHDGARLLIVLAHASVVDGPELGDDIVLDTSWITR